MLVRTPVGLRNALASQLAGRCSPLRPPSSSSTDCLTGLVDGQALRDGITGGGGWSSPLELFAKAATNQT